jgi:hypothetical protein
MSSHIETRARGGRRRTRAVITAAAAMAAAAALAGPAQASLSAVSPVLLESGHPFSYTDSTGMSLELCINDPGCPASPPFLENGTENDEAFYQLASATATLGTKSATIDFNLEAAYLASAITFGRIQATFKGLEPNSDYTVTHPYGTTTFTTDAKGELLGRNRAGQRDEIGGVEGNFEATLATTIGPFLRSTSFAQGDLYIGDGATPGTVTGSPTGTNSIRISGPGLPNVVTDALTGEVSGGLFSDQFTVEGKVAGTAPAPAAFASLSTTSLSFPARRADESSVTRNVVLRNTGQVPLTVSSVSTSSADFTASGCADPVAAGGSCTVTVAFVANSAVGDRTATLNIASNAANNPNLSVALGATITGAATQIITIVQPGGTAVQQVPVAGAALGQQAPAARAGGGAAAQGQGVLPSTASSFAPSRLSLTRRISNTRLRLQGLRASMRLAADTKVVRIAVYKARNGQETGRALYTTQRATRSGGLYRVTLRSRGLLSKLRPGSYVMEVRAGRSAATLGAARRIAFTVTR